MASPPSLPSGPSERFLTEFLLRVDAHGHMRFDAFMQLALYHPVFGYYRAKRTRVGRSAESDFYTSTSSGAFFGEWISAACISLLGKRDAKEYTFVEIGAEPGSGILEDVETPFRAHQTIRLADALSIEGKCIVFSNELFDAQPFRRFLAKDGGWVELGVKIEGRDLIEIEMGSVHAPWLPEFIEAGFHFDAPRHSIELAAAICGQSWSGLFVAADYGKSFRELTEATPAGTARAYSRHTQSNSLLSQPGEQDLTCHVCWDWLESELRAHRFIKPTVESQESFFVHHAGATIAQCLASTSTFHNPRKQALMQLIHPGNLGQKFQVLHGWRD